MKKIKFLILASMLLSLTGCFDNNTMDNIEITTSSYPIKFVVDSLYGEHSNTTSIYPMDSNINDFKITNVSLEQYSKNDMFIFNGLTDEKNFIKSMLKKNKNLKIIDVTSNMIYDYSIEEIWLDPNNLLTVANNIKKGFNEYIKNTYLTNEVNENYEKLKIELTSLDGRYYSVAKNSSNPTIVISDDAFKYLEKYGIEVISLDKDTRTDKDIATAKNLKNSGSIKYIFTVYGDSNDDVVQELIDEGLKNEELYSLVNLKDINLEQSNYIVLMNQNLESLKNELLK